MRRSGERIWILIDFRASDQRARLSRHRLETTVVQDYESMPPLFYNAVMPKRQIGVEVLVEDHFWNDAHGRYVYSFHCPACAQMRLTPELGIYRCDCGSWLIVTNQR